MKSYYVYMLASHRNGTLYIGVTNDIVRRIYEHENGVTGGFTSDDNIKTLVWFEEESNIAEAIRHEKRMKKWPRAWKINVIETHKPQWRDLFPELIS